MDFIINLSNKPDSLTPEQLNELKKVLTEIIKKKISDLENKYKIKIKFPKNLCNIENKPNLPIFIPPIEISPTNLSMYVPLDFILSESTNDNFIERLIPCLKIINNLKKDLELYSSGQKTKEQLDTQYFDWITEKVDIQNNVDDKDKIIDDIIKKLIEKLEHEKENNYLPIGIFL